MQYNFDEKVFPVKTSYDALRNVKTLSRRQDNGECPKRQAQGLMLKGFKHGFETVLDDMKSHSDWKEKIRCNDCLRWIRHELKSVSHCVLKRIKLNTVILENYRIEYDKLSERKKSFCQFVFDDIELKKSEKIRQRNEFASFERDSSLELDKLKDELKSIVRELKQWNFRGYSAFNNKALMRLSIRQKELQFEIAQIERAKALENKPKEYISLAKIESLERKLSEQTTNKKRKSIQRQINHLRILAVKVND